MALLSQFGGGVSVGCLSLDHLSARTLSVRGIRVVHEVSCRAPSVRHRGRLCLDASTVEDSEMIRPGPFMPARQGRRLEGAMAHDDQGTGLFPATRLRQVAAAAGKVGLDALLLTP